MSLARRLMASAFSVASGIVAAQVEYTAPGTYVLIFPEGVETFSAVGIAAGLEAPNVTPFTGKAAGNLHWRNNIPVPASRMVTIQIGDGDGTGASNKETSIKDGGTYLLRASNSNGGAGEDYWLTLGGGGGRGGLGGPGGPGNAGLGGGGPGYDGQGGQGGNYLDTAQGQLPVTGSGGGRGGDINGTPNGWLSSYGEGTGLLGRSADKTTSLGAKLFGYGAWGGPSAGGGDGGVRVIWGDDRSYPDNPPDRASDVAATFVASANGAQNNSSPMPFTFHTDAEEGDLLLVWATRLGAGSFGGFAGISGLQPVGAAYWKQITAADIAASLAGTTTLLGSGNRAWAAAVYRGPRIAVQRAVAPGTASDTVTVPGITKRIDCKRLVLTVSDQDAAAVIPTPVGFTSRASRTTPLDMRLSDIAPADYVNGTNIVMTGLDATTGTTAYLVELY